jgi:NADH-quinone oxidoreductase subunit E
MSARRIAPPEGQPKDFAFTAENLAWARTQIAKYPEGREQSAIIPLLWRAQEQAGGWLPHAAMLHVGEMLGLAPIRVLEIATFYTMFNLAPVGKYFVQLCGTTPCVLRGAEDLKKVCRSKIGDERHVTADGKFSWLEVECLGACVNAPMVQINADFYEDLTPQSLTHVLDELAAGRSPRPGPQIDRQLSAPAGGPTTLTDPALYAPKAPEPKSSEPKAEIKASEPKAPEVKAPAPEAPAAKAAETKAADAKASEPKAPEAKAPEPEVPAAKAPETKAAEATAPEPQAPEAKAAGVKAPKAKAAAAKAPEAKTTGPEASEVKAPEVKAPEPKTAGSKPRESKTSTSRKKKPAAGTATHGGPALTDADPKKPGAAANVSESPVPKPPIADSSDPRRK